VANGIGHHQLKASFGGGVIMYSTVKDECKKFEGEVTLPTPATEHSAGWDFVLREEIVLPPFGRTITYLDVKCELHEGEVLFILPRSSLGIKKGVMLQNTVGVIDKDYFENPDNDGNIAIALFNTSAMVVKLDKGERVAQGIILLHATRAHNVSTLREGGIGSTGRA